MREPLMLKRRALGCSTRMWRARRALGLPRHGLGNCNENLASGAFGIRTKIAFPNANDAPAGARKISRDLAIALAIAFDLRDPILGVPTGAQLALSRCPVTAVPKIPIAENGDAVLHEHQIGTAWKALDVRSVADA